MKVVCESWQWDGVASCVPAIDYDRTFATEFRYDGPRQRHLTRALNPATLQPYGNNGDRWTDYDGDSAYGDFSIIPTENRRSYEPGLGRFDWSYLTNEPDANTETYYHTDHLGTIRGVTGFLATWTEAMTFTAFGERIVGTQNSMNMRFGYVGSYGYESTPNFGTVPNTDIGFLHVGARYYDPATGRFLQRDPIGIRGGSNVFSYALNQPTILVDPRGLDNPVGRPSVFPPPPPGFVPVRPEPIWPKTIEDPQEAQDTAGVTTIVIGVIGIVGGGPGTWAAGLCIAGAYIWDYVEKYY